MLRRCVARHPCLPIAESTCTNVQSVHVAFSEHSTKTSKTLTNVRAPSARHSLASHQSGRIVPDEPTIPGFLRRNPQEEDTCALTAPFHGPSETMGRAASRDSKGPLHEGGLGQRP